MPDKSKDKDIQEMRAEEAQRRSEPGEAPESRRHSGHEPRSDSGRRLLWISNGLMILGVLLLMGALGVNIMLAGSARVLWVRVVAGAAGVCFLAAMVMGYRDLIRWFRTRATQEGLLSLAFTVAVWAIVIFGVYMGQRYSHRIDATKDRLYSLSDKSVAVLDGLSGQVEIVTALRASARPELAQEVQRAKDLISLYESAGRGRVRVEHLNPDRHFDRMNELGIRKTVDVVVVKSLDEGGQSQTLQLYDATNEQKVTSAIMGVTRESKPMIYFIEGYGQYSISETGETGLSTFKKLLEDDLYEVASLNLMTEQGQIPADAHVLVIAGGNQPFPEEHQKAIADWVNAGGKLLLLAPNRLLDEEGDAPDFATILADWGITVRADVVLDPDSSSAFSYIPVASGSGIGEHSITEPFRTRSASVPLDPLVTCSLRVDSQAPEMPGQPPPPGQPIVLLRTHNLAYSKTSREFTSATQEASDTPGPLTLAVCASREIGSTIGMDDEAEPMTTAKVVVIGDEMLAANGDIRVALGVYQRSPSRAFVLNCVHWLAESEDLITITPKTDTSQPITLTKSQRSWNRLVCLLSALVPLVIGVSIWFVRRA
jgi:ABC-2 type transport system permease protein